MSSPRLALWILLAMIPLLLPLVRAEEVRPIPPPGIAVAAPDREALQAGVDELGREIDALRETLKAKPELLDLLPDVQIFHQAVAVALKHDEFFSPKDVASAADLLKEGRSRAGALREGRAPWNTATGLVARGYVSKIDGSVQPYGVVVPASYRAPSAHRFRLDVWCHGRGETLGEIAFLKQRMTSPGEFAPANAFVLHPYGRYCNAYKFAGEVDVFEALDDIRKRYPIDDDRLAIRGFSMGGAAAWHLAVHHPGFWAAAAPGAGFSETPEYLNIFKNKDDAPPEYEQTLWRLYDAVDYALNLFNLPTVAYSGEIDKQKQAADMMAQALADEGIDLVHVIGEGAKHHYTPAAKAEINRRIDAILDAGRDPVPPRVGFTTWTLRYNRSSWVQIDGLAKHWERAQVGAVLARGNGGGPEIETSNVTALTLTMPPGRCPFPIGGVPEVRIDGQDVKAPKPLSDRSWTARFQKVDGQWRVVAPDADAGRLVKRHGLQGPIDDAFMDGFLMVRPTGKPLNNQVGDWTKAELTRALSQWRSQFRGDARVKDDNDVTEADIANYNLVLWGDPSSNALLAKVLDKLPLSWTTDGARISGETFNAGHHVPVLIYPNPLNPNRYVVLNSGFTFRERDYLTNARQTPKLPDFAILDVSAPPDARAPGRVVEAGFFDEQWRTQPRSD